VPIVTVNTDFCTRCGSPTRTGYQGRYQATASVDDLSGALAVLCAACQTKQILDVPTLSKWWPLKENAPAEQGDVWRSVKELPPEQDSPA